MLSQRYDASVALSSWRARWWRFGGRAALPRLCLRQAATPAASRAEPPSMRAGPKYLSPHRRHASTTRARFQRIPAFRKPSLV